MFPATRFICFAAISLLTLTLLNKVHANHWLLGDENSVHCYSADPSQPDAAAQKDIALQGINMRWTVPIPSSDQLAAGKPIESAITVSLSPEFFQGNNGTDLGPIGVGSKTFQDLCYKKIAPNGKASCSSSVSPTPENCCIYHANVHACRQVEQDCQPWVQPMNSTGTSSYVLVTHTNSVTGFLDVPIYFENLVLPADTWTIISHVKILHFQCAIGVLRTVRNADISSTAQASNGDPRHWPTWQFALLIAGTILGVLLLAEILFLVYRKRKANRTASGSNQQLNNDQTVSSANVNRQSSHAMRFSEGYGSPPVSPSQPQHQDAQRFSMMSNHAYQPMIYVPCDQYPPPHTGYATYLSPPAPLNAASIIPSDANMVPMCYPDPNTGRYIYNQHYSHQEPQRPSQYTLRVVGDPNTDGIPPIYSDDSRQQTMDYSFSASTAGKNDRS